MYPTQTNITITGSKRTYDGNGAQNVSKKQKNTETPAEAPSEAPWLPDEMWQVFSTYLLPQDIENTMKDVVTLLSVNKQTYSAISKFNFLWERLQKRYFDSDGKDKECFLNEMKTSQNMWEGSCTSKVISLGEVHLHSFYPHGGFLYTVSSDKEYPNESNTLEIQKWDFKTGIAIRSYFIKTTHSIENIYMKDTLLFLSTTKDKKIFPDNAHIVVYELDSGKDVGALKVSDAENIDSLGEIHKQGMSLFVSKYTREKHLELERFNLNEFKSDYNNKLNKDEVIVQSIKADGTSLYFSFSKSDQEGYIKKWDLTNNTEDLLSSTENELNYPLAVYDDTLYSFVTRGDEEGDIIAACIRIFNNHLGEGPQDLELDEQLVANINRPMNCNLGFHKFKNLILLPPAWNGDTESTEDEEEELNSFYIPVLNLKTMEYKKIPLGSALLTSVFSVHNGSIFVGARKEKTAEVFILDFNPPKEQQNF